MYDDAGKPVYSVWFIPPDEVDVPIVVEGKAVRIAKRLELTRILTLNVAPV